jgi:hypothetical protein
VEASRVMKRATLIIRTDAPRGPIRFGRNARTSRSHWRAARGYSRVAAGTDSIDPGRMAFEAAATTSSPLAREVSRIMAVRHRDAPGEVIVRFPFSFNSRCYSSLT